MSASSPPEGSAPAGPGLPGYLIREARAEDLDAIAGFEVEIARVSFGEEAITDAGLHRRRVEGALGKPGEITLVAVAAPGRPLGWAWLSGRTNSLTGARYGNFRSLAVADVPGRSEIGELLLAAVLRAADEAGLRQLTGKVHARNLGMRALYRKFGFEATHITMEKRAHGPAGPAEGEPGVGRAAGAGGPAEGGPGVGRAAGAGGPGEGGSAEGGPGAGGAGAGGAGAGGAGGAKLGVPPAMMVKCVIWDLDNTLLSGVYLESGAQRPPPDLAMLGVLEQLRDRGIIHAIATRNPPEAADHAARVTGLEFAAAECGWGRKSDAVRRITADLGLALDAVAFVDDDLYERAEVSLAVPQALVLSPEDMADAVGWPEFSPATVTAEARRRGEMYAERRRREQEARAFAGSSDEFLRYCGTEVTIAPAADADAPRLHELSVRTHQFNTTGEALPEAVLRTLIASPAHQVTTVRLSDRLGDDGMVGGCVVEPGSDRGWTVTLLMMSCRAMGRGAIEALLTWLARSAARGGAQALAVPCLVSPRNVPLRLALAASGFRASEGGPPGLPGARFSRTLSGPLPGLPAWVTAPDEP